MIYKKGFTIVELLIAIVVIAILAAISVVAYNGVQQRAQNSALQSESSSLVRRLQLYHVSNDSYPSSISACPSPSEEELCLPLSSSLTANYQRTPPGGSGYIIDNSPAYSLQLESDSSFLYTSNAERTGSREFIQYTDLAPLIDKYGQKRYELSFDIKSADPSVQNRVNVYFQNGSSTRYSGLSQGVTVTRDYQRYTIYFTPSNPNTSVPEAMLAFFGTYNTGNIPIVKNLEFKLAL